MVPSKHKIKSYSLGGTSKIRWHTTSNSEQILKTHLSLLEHNKYNKPVVKTLIFLVSTRSYDKRPFSNFFTGKTTPSTNLKCDVFLH